jgi:meso-butanediol dehydrogenase / (S,S)-butanediol dehydrogenase / diacetyl reductase
VTSPPRVAFVTGAGSGIGRATASRLNREGYRVGLFDVDADALSAVEEEISREGGRGIALVGSVTSIADLTGAVQAVVDRFGTVDACAACAGVEVSGPFLESTDADWDRAFSVNAVGVANTARAVLPGMVARNRGAFTAIASDAGTQGFAEWSAYCASKHAVVGLIKSMAVEFGPRGVRSNVVCPSFVDTPMADRIFEGSPPAERAAWARTVPLGRFASADEVARVIAHLLSEEASFTNGLVYAIDGGSTAGPAAIG